VLASNYVTRSDWDELQAVPNLKIENTVVAPDLCAQI